MRLPAYFWFVNDKNLGHINYHREPSSYPMKMSLKTNELKRLFTLEYHRMNKERQTWKHKRK